LAVFLGHDGVPDPLRRLSGGSVVPCFAFPEVAAVALAAVVAYSEWRRRPTQRPPRLGQIQRRAARTIVAKFMSGHPDGGWMDTDLAVSLLRSYGIPMVTSCRADDGESAVNAAHHIGYPVAAKSATGQILHRTDLGAVKLGLASPDEVRAAVQDIQTACGDECGVVVQPMLTGGVEMAVGITRDRTVGPIIMVGIGGIATDLIADRSFRLPPLGRLDAHELIRSLRASPLLFGYRGAHATNVKALEDLILRVSAMAMDLPELADLDLNPILAMPEAATAVDVKLRLAPMTDSSTALRRLSPRT
jgi:acyl-CoA synthetase (NDP forming)